MSELLTNCAGQPDQTLIRQADAWAVLPTAWRQHAGVPAGRASAARRRRIEQLERVRWIPLSPETRAMLADARMDAGLTPHELDRMIAQRNGFVWDVEHGFHSSIDPDVFALWLDCCQADGKAVPA